MKHLTRILPTLLLALALLGSGVQILHAQTPSGGDTTLGNGAAGSSDTGGGVGSSDTGGGVGSTDTGGGTGKGAGSGGLVNPLNNIKSLPDLLTAILNALIDLGSIVLVLMLVFVGFQFVAAQGNEEKLKSARSALIWTLIGGLILLGAKSISLVIQSTVNQL